MVAPPPFAISLPAVNFEAARINDAAQPPGLNRLVGTVYGVGWDPNTPEEGRRSTVRYLVMVADFFEWVSATDWNFDPANFEASAYNRGEPPVKRAQ
jgi:hypothetical protein